MGAATGGSAAAPDIRVLVRRFLDEVLNGRDLEGAFAEMVAEDFVEENPIPGQGPGREGLREILAAQFAAFPDLHWELEDLLVEGDRVATRSVWTGTHRGEFMGVPATGRSVAVEAWTTDRYANGQLVSSRIIMDALGMLTQMGVLQT